MSNVKEKIITALDVSYDDAVKLIESIRDNIGFYKVNALYVERADIINKIKEFGGKVFLDLKFHDIPFTVGNHCRAATKKGIDMMTIHTCGGIAMMEKAAESVKQTADELGINKPILLGITVLTSIDLDTLNEELRINGSIEEQVVHLAKLAKQAGLDGVVASPKETALIKRECGEDFLVVTPGIRPRWSVADDQKRITTPKDAIDNGSDFLVIGRAITKSENKVEAVRKIIEEMK